MVASDLSPIPQCRGLQSGTNIASTGREEVQVDGNAVAGSVSDDSGVGRGAMVISIPGGARDDR